MQKTIRNLHLLGRSTYSWVLASTASGRRFVAAQTARITMAKEDTL
jgi:hypothetical protein